jgi:excinuclease ABC subunit A
VELALKLGDGRLLAAAEGEEPFWMSERFACIDCGVSLPPIEPRMFSFNGPHGACPGCDGIGSRVAVDAARVVGDESRSLREGVVLAWGRRASVALATELSRAVEALGVDPDVPWKKLPEVDRHAILLGTADRVVAPARAGRPAAKTPRKKAKAYVGIVPRLTIRLASEAGQAAEAVDLDDPDESEGGIGDDELGRFTTTRVCDVCGGRRLRPEALAVTLGGRDIAQLGAMPLRQLSAFVETLTEGAAVDPLSPRSHAIAEPLLKAVKARVGFLIDVGLDYLALDRSAQTLSSGEGQRIRLATQIGAALVGVLYVLDEPSIGLHQRDNARLVATLERLRDLGNTVLVVEHDEQTMRAADHLVDLGPGAGEHGGRIVAQGTASEVEQVAESLTGQFLSGAARIEVPARRRTPTGAIEIRGATQHNLQGIDVRVPLGTLTCVTGVSGSGKSTLVNDVLYKAVANRLHRARQRPGAHREVGGIEALDKIIAVDQSPIGRTPRSNPATYTGLFDVIRELFSKTAEARARGYKPGRFSFNVKGGRCEVCRGDGQIRIEMHFLPDVYVPCEQCHGRRYNRETLEVRFKGKTIADVLDMSIEEALVFFEHIPTIRRRLATLNDVGLGYVRLGQPATTLSGGEAQRVKLASELSKIATGRTLYILDEPTTGLHFADVKRLLEVLHRLVDAGNSVVVIEHNLDVIKSADRLIDLGPEGGDEGGQVIATGTPEQVAAVAASYTGRFLEPLLGRAPTVRRGARRKLVATA